MARPKAGESVHADHGLIVPDYAPPSALMVPHFPAEPHSHFTAIAKAASAHVGVILLSPQAADSEEWASRQPDPSRYTVVGAVYDTPWIRDRSPIAIRRGDDVDWVLPQLPKMNREQDDALFSKLSARPVRDSPLKIEQGNLIAGPEGLVLSTHRVLHQNELTSVSPLVEAARPLGIRRWVLFPSFAEELSGHADVHVRFLSPDLVAVAWNEEDESNRTTTGLIEAQVRDALPAATIVRIPMRRRKRHYASLVNWIQLGRVLLIPRFPITSKDDLSTVRSRLEPYGFECCFVDSPTHQLGGSLHCLTASIYV